MPFSISIGKNWCRLKPIATVSVAVAMLSFVWVGNSPSARAIELIPVCQEHYERFSEWNSYYKAFAYGVGGGRAGCASAVSDLDAVAKCDKALKPWGAKCRVYAKSPVNGKLRVVWEDSVGQIAKASSQLGHLSDKAICRIATTGSIDGWTKQHFYNYVIEAKSRGLTPDDCNVKLGFMSKEEKERKRREAELERVRLQEAERNKKRISEAEQAKKIKEAIRIAELSRIEAQQIAEIERHRAEEVKRRKRIERERKRRIAEARKKALGPLHKKHKDAIAVIVGNRKYKGRTPSVDFAHNDAEAMKRFVIEQLGYRNGNIIDLRDATRNELAEVFGTERTHEGKLYDWIKPNKSDVLVFYSGHGVPGLKDRRPYLLPVDGNANRAEITGFPVDVLYSNLAKTPARSITVFLDACFSGESPKGMLVQATSGISIAPKIPTSSKRMVVVTAAQGDQFASWDEKAEHGLFTKHLLEALNGKADGEGFGNSDGKVSLKEVQRYLDDEMTYQARRTFGRRQKASVRGSSNTVLASVLTPSISGDDPSGIEEMDATYMVLTTANVRSGPSTSTEVVGKLKANSSVNVTGKVEGKNWYRLNDGGFVFGDLIQRVN